MIYTNNARKIKMDQYEAEDFRLRADVFKALGHPTRLWVVDFLAEGPRCVTEIVEGVDGGISAVSQHLAILRQYGIIKDVRRGRQIYYELADESIVDLCTMLSATRARKLQAPPQKRRGLTEGPLVTILVLSLSLSAVLFALHPYVRSRKGPPPPPIACMQPPLDAPLPLISRNVKHEWGNRLGCSCGMTMDAVLEALIQLEECPHQSNNP
jgi:ArsR family transcriptional regulator